MPSNRPSNEAKTFNSTRRKFIKIIGFGGVTATALPKIIERAKAESNGVPIVYTKDRYGEPDKIKFISRERKRRLDAAYKLSFQEVVDEHPSVHSMGVTQLSGKEEGLGLELYIDPSITEDERRMLPDQLSGISTVFTKQTPGGTRDYSCSEGWGGISIDPVEGGCAVANSGLGTLCLAGYDNDAELPVLLSAGHVFDDGNDFYIYQDGRNVGVRMTDNQDMDAIKFEATDDAISLLTVSDSQPDLTGTWTHKGLTDATTWENIDAIFSGRKNCYYTGTCADTQIYGNLAKYEAVFIGNNALNGDSGGPWVDANGKLIAMHLGNNTNGDDVGGTGDETLNGVGMDLVRDGF